MGEILTVSELAGLLKMSKSQVYELTNERTRSGDLREHPLPSFKIGASVRFLESEVDGWLAKIKQIQRSI